MRSQSSFVARSARRQVPGAFWLGLLAIMLHVCVPFMGPALSSAASAHHAHDHGAHSHHEGSAESTAESAPLNPDQICIGDCPWHSLNDRPLPALIRAQLALLPVGIATAKMPVASSLPPIFQPGTHSRPRAPPLFS